MKELKRAKKYIAQARTIAISGHINPDGDSLGSLFALGLGLENTGKTVYMLDQGQFSSRYDSLPGAQRLVKTPEKKIDLAIAVDCSRKELLGKNLRVFRKAGAILEIDHHQFRKPFGKVSLIDRRAAAVGEIVFALLKSMKITVTKDIAENILTSIIVETNSFRLPSIRPFTFKLCSILMRAGIEFSKIVEMVYWSKTKEETILSGICLSRCKFLRGGRLVWSIIKKKDFVRVKGMDYDVDAVANEMRAIKDAEIVVLFRERSKKTLRVSIRSKGDINTADIAERYVGGGHLDAAGCYIRNSKASIKKFLSVAESFLDR